jgi:hypothetical protein
LDQARIARSRHRAWFAVTLTLLLAAALLLFTAGAGAPSAPGASKVRSWSYEPDVHLHDSEPEKLKDADGDSQGNARLIDTFVAPTKERFRNREGGVPKRIYRIRTVLAMNMKRDFEVQGAVCSQQVGQGSFALTGKDNARLFYPPPRDNLETHSLELSITALFKGFSVQLPLPPIQYHTETSQVGVEVSTPSSRKHAWGFDDGDGTTQHERYGLVGHWVAAARGLEIKIRCKAFGSQGVDLSVAIVRAEHSFNP